MPFLAADEKVPLFAEQEEIQNALAGWGLIAAVGGGVLLPITAGLAAVPAAFCAPFVYVLAREQNAVTRALNDPPRQDFATATRARSRRYLPGQLGSSPIAVATDQAITASLRKTAYLEAMVRADERAQGARQADQAEFAQLREWEAYSFLERARAAEIGKALRFESLSLTWAQFAAQLSGGQEDLAPPEADAWGPAAAVRATRLVVRDLPGRFMRRPDVTSQARLTEGIVEAARSTWRLARSGEAFFLDASTPLAAEIAARSWPERQRALPDPNERDASEELFELGSRALAQGDADQAIRLFGKAAAQLPQAIREPVESLPLLEEADPRPNGPEKPRGLPRSPEEGDY